MSKYQISAEDNNCFIEPYNQDDLAAINEMIDSEHERAVSDGVHAFDMDMHMKNMVEKVLREYERF